MAQCDEQKPQTEEFECSEDDIKAGSPPSAAKTADFRPPSYQTYQTSQEI